VQVDDWVDRKLAEIAERLPEIIHSDPASFSCGFNAGYKQAVTDLAKILGDIEIDRDGLKD